ncbi:Aste57867_17056 [Aphanomyces stellatus]|uniref:Aste57867_17056 protein n=1 Tax=Aphanomyces stellatus TaxID=120398 RepID=A0A485L829_9STRA|nr:hypothetical protein As57867_016998 [Aphanomyces stellatus]VFT93817.1 Aste57867_17056 [Aphanomyces stellatus]
MDEILALQRELAAVQEAKETLRLSERNVVDLLLKLQALKKVDLIFTLNAKSVLTPAQLRKEIYDDITAHMGRVSLRDIQTSVNVDMSYVEQYAKEVVETSEGQVKLLGGELLTEWYLDSIMADTNEVLHESGQMTIGELAQQYGFSVDFMRAVVDARLGTSLKAHVHGSVLFTEAYVARQVAQIRGVFSAITRPTFLPEIVASTGLDERLLTQTVADLIQSQELCGSMRGREYVPAAFLDIQRDSILTFFATNGFVPHTLTSQLQVAGRPSDFIRKRFPDCVALDDYVIDASLLLQLEGAVDGLAQDPTWLDARAVLPPGINDANMGMLLSKAMTHVSTKVVVQVGGVFAVSAAFMAQVSDRFQTHAKAEAAHAALLSLHTRPHHVDTTNGPIKGKSKDKAAKKGKSTTIDATDCGICPTRDEQARLLMDWFDHCVDEDDFVDTVLDALQPSIQNTFRDALAKAVASVRRGDSASRHADRTETFEAQFDQVYSHLVVFQKGWGKLNALVKTQQDGLACVEHALLESLALALCVLVLQFVNERDELELPGVFSESPSPAATPSSLSPQHMAILEKKAPSVAPAIQQMWSTAVGGARSLEAFMAHVPVVAEALSMPLRKLDRKKEKALVAAHKESLVRAAQANEADMQHLLGVVCSLVFQTITSLALQLPTSGAIVNAYTSLQAAFQASVPPPALAILDELCAAAHERPGEKPDELVERAIAIGLSKDFAEFR